MQYPSTIATPPSYRAALSSPCCSEETFRLSVHLGQVSNSHFVTLDNQCLNSLSAVSPLGTRHLCTVDGERDSHCLNSLSAVSPLGTYGYSDWSEDAWTEEVSIAFRLSVHLGQFETAHRATATQEVSIAFRLSVHLGLYHF